MGRFLYGFHPPIGFSIIDETDTKEILSGLVQCVGCKMKDPLHRRIGIKTPAVLISDDNQEKVEDQGFMGELLKIPSMKESVINNGIALGRTHGRVDKR
jgi:hypothetical protein